MEAQIANEGAIRLSVFAGVFVIMAILEALQPRKQRTQPRGKRWLTNISVVVINTLALRLLFPVLAVAYAANNSWGLLNMVELPEIVEVIVAVILMDMAIYWQHVASHKIPILWKVHRMHHCDRDIDVTTGTRFHPIEIILSMLFKLAVITILGPPALGVFIFEILLNGSAMFNHANFFLPKPLDRIIRSLFVTPDMHRIHHSVHMDETDSNYGFFMAVWDRIFGTYIDQPRDGHDDMLIGMKQFQTEKPANLLWAMMLPFRK